MPDVPPPADDVEARLRAHLDRVASTPPERARFAQWIVNSATDAPRRDGAWLRAMGLVFAVAIGVTLLLLLTTGQQHGVYTNLPNGVR